MNINGEYIAFLYIQYSFDGEGALQTDLFVKPTDSRSYLQFGSTHPNHVFSAIVYSQCLRLRRTINCNQRHANRLGELKQAFMNSNYPSKMVNNIITKVLSMDRVLKTLKIDQMHLSSHPLPHLQELLGLSVLMAVIQIY